MVFGEESMVVRILLSYSWNFFLFYSSYKRDVRDFFFNLAIINLALRFISGTNCPADCIISYRAMRSLREMNVSRKIIVYIYICIRLTRKVEETNRSFVNFDSSLYNIIIEED